MGNSAQKILSLPNANALLAQAELRDVAAQLKKDLKASGVAIAGWSSEAGKMVCVASCGESSPPVGTPLDVNLGISGQCIREERMLHSEDTRLDSRVNREACEHLGIRSLAIAPIRAVGGIAGVVEIFASEPGCFGHEALDRLAQTAEQLSLPPKKRAKAATESPSDKAVASSGKSILPFSKPLPSAVGAVPMAADRINRASFASTHPLSSPAHSTFLGQWRMGILVLVLVFAVVPASWLISGFSSRTANAHPRLDTVNRGVNFNSNTTTAQQLLSEASAPVRVLMAKALAGDTDAQASLADHYAHGDGVSRDGVKAAAWYIVASSRGNASATRSAVEISSTLQQFEVAQVRFNLGTMFRDGIGTARDLKTAYLWFSLAGLAGDVRAEGVLRNLEQVMSRSDIADADRRTKSWLRSHHQPTKDIPPKDAVRASR